MSQQLRAYPEGVRQSTPSLRGIGGLCVLGILPAFCLASELTRTEAYMGTAFLVAAMAVFWRSSTLRFGTLSLVGIFSIAAGAHALCGLLLAGPTTSAIWGNTRIVDLYPRAFMVITAGLLAAAIGYRFGLRRRMGRIARWCGSLAIDDAKLLRWTQVLTIAGALLIILVYYSVGYIPLLTSAPGQSRYLTEEVSANHQREEWVVSRGMDLLTFALPLMIAWCLWKPGWRNITIASAGVLALLLPLRRANLGSIVVAVVVIEVLKTGRLKRRYLAIVALVALAYGASQFVFFNLVNQGSNTNEALIATGSALPEVRDLGWMMSISDEKWYGVTFLQAVLPIPSFVSDFSHENSLRQVTTRAIGLDFEGQTGGLRLTLPGESYFNFGYLGVAIVGFFFGLACAALDTVVAYFEGDNRIAGLYLSTLLFTWLCFWLYLAGTQAAATIKMGLILLICILFLSRARWEHPASAG